MSAPYHRMLLFVALAVLATPLAAQEVVPPPAPQGVTPPPPPLPPDQGQGFQLFGGQFLNALINGQQGGAPPLDINRINAAIAALVQPLVAGDSSIESLQIYLDPAKTNLANDTATGMANVALRRTIWSNSPSKLHLDLRATADLRTPGAAQAVIDARILMQTAVVPAADFALQRFKARQAGQTAGPPTSADDFFQNYLREKLARTQSLSSFEDVVDLFQYICALRFLAQNDNIDRLKDAVTATTDPGLRNALSVELAAARSLRESMGNVRTHIERDASGHVRSFDVPLANVALTSGIVLERLDLHVTETEINALAKARVQRGVEVYALVKPVVLLTLQQLQQRDPATVARQRAFIQGWLQAARPFLFGGEF